MEQNQNKESRGKLLAQLFVSFAKIGVMTFGGGLAMLPMLERELVENKKSTLADFGARALLVIEKKFETPIKYPRMYAKIKKSPL